MFMGQGVEALGAVLPNWGIFYQPLGFVLFFAATFAETNRAPFDLPEAEAELVAGYHTEYGGLKMNMFYIGEYGHMIVASAMIAIFYFGGFEIGTWFGVDLTGMVQSWAANAFTANVGGLIYSFLMLGVMSVKILLLLWIFIWVRWTLPRFRYDQLMDLGWKKMLPWALFNTVATAAIVTLFHGLG